ncbi:MAG: Crp/Fnr family transcriptional regulator [Clostridia bacterium]|nr:Crp/Fnr family transcriptional regulator [Clostridia bacterium]
MEYDILEIFPFLNDLTTSEYNTFTTHCIYRKMEKGQMLVGDNDRCGGIPFVVGGSIRLFRTSENGKDITLYKVNKGELCVLAAVCSFANLKYDFTAEALEDSMLTIVSVEGFNHMLNTSRVFSSHVFAAIADKLIVALNAIELLNFSSIEDRIKSYLNMHSDDEGVVTNTHENIAKDIGSSREVVSRKLKELENEGYVQLKRGKIVLK